MFKVVLLTVATLVTCFLHAQSQHLFRIIQNDRIGYMNGTGNIVIKAEFAGGNDFHEGLAAVRRNGFYGFINDSGNFVIKPEYDFATKFCSGLALVYKNGKPQIIDKEGSIALPGVYKELTYLDKRRSFITTLTDKVGVLDVLTHKLVIDTAFDSISEFKYGVAIVNEYVSPQNKRQQRVAAIDTNGHFVVPFGKYRMIGEFVEGFAVVEIEKRRRKNGWATAVIDTRGKLLFKRLHKDKSYINGDFRDGYARISLYKSWIPEKAGVISTSANNYEGFIDLKGKVLLNDTNYRAVKDFSNGRAFVQDTSGDYFVIDRSFARVGDAIYVDVPYDRFSDGLAIVRTRNGVGIIDTTGNFVVKPQYEEIDQIGVLSNHIFYCKYVDDNKLFGISDLHGNMILDAVMSDFDRSGFLNGILKAIIDDKLTYLNNRGKVVWQEDDANPVSLKPLNIDFMNRGYFYAYSTPKANEQQISGGWATSFNQPQKIVNHLFADNLLSVTIDTTKIDTFANRHLGYQLYISNTTVDTINFHAQDSRLNMKLQAQNSIGEWKDIEYLPGSWCGNSYHTIQLEPKTFYAFTIPQYEGELSTKIRAELQVIDKSDPQKQYYIYSNMINGSVNPGQFWNKSPYYPTGLMDPYYD